MQKPHPPIVVGGHSPSAFRRAVARGDGWYGFLRDLGVARLTLLAPRREEEILRFVAETEPLVRKLA